MFLMMNIFFLSKGCITYTSYTIRASIGQIHYKTQGRNMGEYKPTEQELIEVLCRARETDWEAADYRANRALAKMMDGTVRYERDAPFGEYGSFLFRQKNYQPIPPDYMHNAVAWRGMSLSEIIDNIFSQTGSEADKYRQVLHLTLDRYRLAALRKLSDVTRWGCDIRYKYFSTTTKLTSADIPETPLRGWFIEFLGNSKNDESDCVDDEHLIKKVLVVQDLQKRFDSASLSRAEVAADQPQQTAAPADGVHGQQKSKRPAGMTGFFL
ncbi:MAG: hypothetical protein WCI64_06695 [Chlorobium sp.]